MRNCIVRLICGLMSLSVLVGCSSLPKAPDGDELRSFLLHSEYDEREKRNVLGTHLSRLDGDHASATDVWQEPATEQAGCCDAFAQARLEGSTSCPSCDERLLFVEDDWDHAPELALDVLLAEAFRLNPSVEAAEARWRAVSQRYPQVVSLADPQFRALSGVQLDVANSGSLDDFRQRYQFQQHVPFFGKRKLRGDIALAEATAVSQEVSGAKIDLAAAVKAAFFDYLTLRRKAALHERDSALLEEQEEALRWLVAAGQIPKSELQQVELERLAAAQRGEQFRRAVRLAQARINTLLVRPPDRPLPPPRDVEAVPHLPEPSVLRQVARAQRPDRAAGAARIESAETAVQLALLEFLPDFYAVVRVDAIDRSGGQDFLRTQAGFNVDVPIRVFRRRGALKEAEARVQQARAELQRLDGRIDFEVQSALEEVEESQAVLALFPRMLEISQSRIDGLERGDREDRPQEVLQRAGALREHIRYQVQECDARAQYYRRLVELERAAAMPLIEARHAWDETAELPAHETESKLQEAAMSDMSDDVGFAPSTD